MIKTLLVASALSLAAFTSANAAMPSFNDNAAVSNGMATGLIHLAKSENSGSGNSGSGHSGGHDDNDSNDDNGNDSMDDNGDDNGVSGSGRDKPRIPGGSGCDDAGDVAEHPECSAQ